MQLGGQPSFNPTRRQWLKTAMAAGFAAVGWLILEPFTLQLEQVDVVLPDLPPSLHGLRIALLSDMHVGNFAGPALVTKAVARSGHSHGGQVRLPFLGALTLPPMSTCYLIGLQQVLGYRLKVYTSRGIGVTGLPVRLLCPPEVTLLRLRRG